MSGDVAEMSARIERLSTALWLSHYYWLAAAKEALQGDLGKLRRHVALSEGATRESIADDMRAALGDPA